MAAGASAPRSSARNLVGTVPDFTVEDVTSWAVADQEPAGGDPKLWLLDGEGERWLFKPVTQKEDRRQGEDWSEFLAAGVARSLGVPAAEVRLARRGDVEGCLSRNVRPEGWSDQPGSVLLAEVVDDFDKHDRCRRGHTLKLIRRVLQGFDPPPAFTGPVGWAAFDVFTGFLVLDALIANQDRHSDNWSVLVAVDGQRRLMASYDHASSLGFNLTDREREERLRDGSLEGWASRGRATRFQGRRTALVDLADQALAMAGPDVRADWMGRLAACDASVWSRLVSSTPVMSGVARTFVLELLDTNRRRVLDACQRGA